MQLWLIFSPLLHHQVPPNSHMEHCWVLLSRPLPSLHTGPPHHHGSVSQSTVFVMFFKTLLLPWEKSNFIFIHRLKFSLYLSYFLSTAVPQVLVLILEWTCSHVWDHLKHSSSAMVLLSLYVNVFYYSRFILLLIFSLLFLSACIFFPVSSLQQISQRRFINCWVICSVHIPVYIVMCVNDRTDSSCSS